MKFYLGTDRPNWLWEHGTRHPLFVSRRTIAKYRNLKPATTRWALDSGGFTELNLYGEWQTTPHRYVAQIQRYADQLGGLDFAAPQDWMCEPEVLRRTGLTVEEHQRRTTYNYLTLRTLSPTLPIIPVLQGWHPDDYRRHLDQYTAAGIDLTKPHRVGIGTVCRRADLGPMQQLIAELSDHGIALHGFGIKRDGLPTLGHYLASADSLAWSFAARKARRPLCGETHRARTCNHCRTWANAWADDTLRNVGNRPIQLALPTMPL